MQYNKQISNLLEEAVQTFSPRAEEKKAWHAPVLIACDMLLDQGDVFLASGLRECVRLNYRPGTVDHFFCEEEDVGERYFGVIAGLLPCALFGGLEQGRVLPSIVCGTTYRSYMTEGWRDDAAAFLALARALARRLSLVG